MSITVRLPAKHAHDWYQRCGDDYYLTGGTRLVDISPLWIHLQLSDKALADLIADAEFYAECMGPYDTGDIDYRPAARRCLNALRKQGVAWHHHGPAVVLGEHT